MLAMKQLIWPNNTLAERLAALVHSYLVCGMAAFAPTARDLIEMQLRGDAGIGKGAKARCRMTALALESMQPLSAETGN